MDHGSMSGGMDMGSDTGAAACKISMLFNWYTIDACILTDEWHIRSIGQYVGSLLGVFLIVVGLEATRRLHREYDRRIKRNYYMTETRVNAELAKSTDMYIEVLPFRPTTRQHFISSLFYLIQFSVSYILMLIAMYFNGGFLLAIFFGGATGYFIFARDTNADTETPVKRGECC